jgi:O-succinylbenzoate synthase
MKIDLVELRHLRMELLSPFQTSFGVMRERDVLLVAVVAEGRTGWGECPAANDPFYSPETPDTAHLILERYLAPALLEGRLSGLAETFHDECEFLRGHSMAKAAMEAALWDLEAQRRGVPLHELLGGTQIVIQTGVSVGIQPSVDHLVQAVGRYVDLGYRRIKIKIRPGWDIEPVGAVAKAFPDAALMVDANAAYSPSDIKVLEALDELGLMMIEQPFAHDDLVDHARLQKRIATPVCLDESADSLSAVRAALELGACRLVNIKQARVGGLSQAIRIHDLCRDAGVPVWAGGMLETGIGRALNIALATLENFTIPGDISASRRYWHEDIIEPEVEVSADGTIAVGTAPGLSYKPRLDRIECLTERLVQMRA